MKLKILIYFAPLLLLLLGCTEEEHQPISKSSGKPPKVENLEFTATNGGVDITYDIPSAEGLLYVKAVYVKSDGSEVDVKASVYKNSLQILGFADTKEKSIKVYTVNRSEVASEPIVITVSPLPSPLSLIQQTVSIKPDFGGANVGWENTFGVTVGVEILAENKQGDLTNVKVEYTDKELGEGILRGYEAVPTKFAVVLRDLYNNSSDTIYPATSDKLVTPLFEELLDKSKIKRRPLQNDANWDRDGRSLEDVFNGDFTDYATTDGFDDFPVIFTLDLGGLVTLSRFKVHQRGFLPGDAAWAFKNGNPKRYDVYGAKEIPGEDGNLDDWILLKECTAIKPSGWPEGVNSSEDIEHFYAGDEFVFDSPEEIRYLRFVVHKTWSNWSTVFLSEITFWGDASN